MAIYKIFPSKDATMYTISQSMNTGLDEILEASTAIQAASPQVSRYLLEFSQTEINNFVEKHVSGSGVTRLIINDTGVGTGGEFLYDQDMSAGPTYPTSSDSISGQTLAVNNNLEFSIVPSSSFGDGYGQRFLVGLNSGYFIPGVDIVDDAVVSGSIPTGFAAADGTYGPFIFSHVAADNDINRTTSSLSSSVNLTIENNTLVSAIVQNNGSASYVEAGYYPVGRGPLNDGGMGDLYISKATMDAAYPGVFTFSGPTDYRHFWFNLNKTHTVTVPSFIRTLDSQGFKYKTGDKLIFSSQSFDPYPMSDDVSITLSSPTVSGSNWEDVPAQYELLNSAAVVTGVGMDQTLKVYATSGSWNMGTGKFDNDPVTTDGVSWTFRNYSGSAAGSAIKWAESGAMTTAANQQILSTTVGTINSSLTNVVGNGSQGGTGAQFTITTTGAQFTITTVTCTAAGTGYIQGDTITIAAADLTGGNIGTVTTDLIFKVTAVDGFGAYSVASHTGSSPGGGNWYTGSSLGLDIVKEQVFSYGNTIDLKVDVTNYIKTWYTASLVDAAKGFPNNGFLVKQSSSKEFINNLNTTATFRYFSVDTNTIYPPLLNMKWEDYYFTTGSSTNKILGTQEAFMSIYNNDGTYYSGSVARLRIAAIPKYPDRVFQTASLYTTNFYLPENSSSYAIKDTDTNEFVIDFDDKYTNISADTTSSYFDVYMNGLEPERYYTILIKTKLDGTTQIYDEDIMFKVING